MSHEPPPGGSAGGTRCPYCNSPVAVEDTLPAEARCPACGGSFRVEVPTGTTLPEEVRTLDRYVLLEAVGRGTFGVVWRARDTALDQTVALKVPNPRLQWTAEMLARIRAEARALAQLRHAGIVRVHTVVEDNGLPVIVSDFISGLPLHERLTLRKLTFEESARLAADVGDALDHAHSRKLFHRDVKPANIMLEAPEGGDSVGRPVLVDFGLALHAEAEVVMTVDGQILGTPAYMSPEQAAGRAHEADARSDVYSLGVVLYQLLTGEVPFRGTRTMILHQVQHEEPRPPRRLNDKIPRDLETVCLKAMAKERGWRYPAAREMADDLRRYLDREPIRARRVGPGSRLWLWCRRKPALAAASFAAAASAACVLAFAVAFAVREREHSAELAGALAVSDANLRTARHNLAESHLTHGLALCEQREIGRGMLWLAKALESAPPDDADLCRYLRLSLAAWRSQQCPLRACLRCPDALAAVGFSPDGGSCVTVSRGGVCELWDAATGAPRGPPLEIPPGFSVAAAAPPAVAAGYPDGSVLRWTLPGGEPAGPRLEHPGSVTAVALSGDGSTVLTTGYDDGVTLWRAPGGGPPLQLCRGQKVRCLSLSPDGRLAVTGGEDRAARVWEVATGKLLHTLPHDGHVRCAAFARDGRTLATGSSDGSVRLWDASRGNPLAFHVRHPLPVNAVAVSPDGRFVFSAGEDKGVRVWSAAASDLAGAPLPHNGTVTALAVSPDGSLLLAGGGDRTARLWSVPALEGHSLDTPGQGWVRRIVFSPDDRTLLTAGGQSSKAGFGSLWDARTGRLLGTPLAHANFAAVAAYSPDGRTVLTASDDGTVRLADAVTGQPGPTLRHDKPVRAAAFSPDGKLVATGGEDTAARLWDAETGKPRGDPLPHTGVVIAVAFNRDGDRFLTASGDGRFTLWRTADLAPAFPTAQWGRITRAVFSHDGKRVLVWSGTEARLYDATRGAFTGPTLSHPDKIRSAEFSPDDRAVLTAGEDGTARIWDAASRFANTVSFTHGMPVNVALFSPDGSLVLTGGADGVVRLWDVRTGRSVGPPYRHRDRVSAAAFSHDGRLFAAAGTTAGSARLRETPVAVEGDPEEVLRQTEILTGMTPGDSGEPSVLDAEAREERRARPKP